REQQVRRGVGAVLRPESVGCILAVALRLGFKHTSWRVSCLLGFTTNPMQRGPMRPNRLTVLLSATALICLPAARGRAQVKVTHSTGQVTTYTTHNSVYTL